ncbi:MAG: peptide transporter ATP-binding protein [Devosia sp.]|jgi:oligopeptide/dipeptide ABC transporter ATP-binding protein|nr:peptide transporter ATP-binding protein [Devosia sp.]
MFAPPSPSAIAGDLQAQERLLSVTDLGVRYAVPGAGFGQPQRYFEVLDDITFDIARGETLGLVGESGSGKSTIGRALLRRIKLSSGRIDFEGRDITNLEGEEVRQLRKRMQLIFQDPYASLNPRMSVGELIAEPLIVHGLARNRDDARDRVLDLLDCVSLPRTTIDRHLHGFSGGQRQRIGIARALALQPAFIVADEPVSALDVSVRAQVINLMQDLQRSMGLSYLFIGHDLGVIRHISQRIAIIHSGRIIEIGDRDSIYQRPQHPYSRALLAAIPVPVPGGRVKSSVAAPAGSRVEVSRSLPGCRYRARCPVAIARCSEETPRLKQVTPTHAVACWQH